MGDIKSDNRAHSSLMSKRQILKKLKRPRRWLVNNDRSYVLYIFGLAALVLGLAIYTIFGSTNTSTLYALPVSPDTAVMYTALAFFASGYLLEAVRTILAWRKYNIMRVFIVALGAIIVLGSYLLSHLLVNFVTRVDPGRFDLAVSIIAIPIAIILWWLLLAAFLLLILYPITFIVHLISSEPRRAMINLAMKIRNSGLYRFILDKRKVPYSEPPPRKFIRAFAILLGRVIGVVTVALALLLVPVQAVEWSGKLIDKSVINTVAYAGHMPVSEECNNYVSGERVKPISNNKISVAVPDGTESYTFETRPCEA